MQSYLADHLPPAHDDDGLGVRVPQEIAQHRAESKEQEEIKEAFSVAGDAAFMAAVPVVTAAGIAMIFSPSSRGSYMDFTACIRMLGVPVAIGGLVVDAVKLPVLSVFSLGAVLYGVGRWVKSLFVKPNDVAAQKKEIMESAAHRFANTCQLLVSMRLETPNSILDKIKSFQEATAAKNKQEKRGMALLCGLTALNTAFASRRLDASCILLANGRVLFRKKCPSEGRPFFDAILRLRELLKRAGLDNKSNAQATPLLLEWLPLLKTLTEVQLVVDRGVDLRANNLLVAMSVEQRELTIALVQEIHRAGTCAIGSSQLKQHEYAMSNAAHDTVRDVPDLASPPSLSASVASANAVGNQAQGIIVIPRMESFPSSSSSNKNHDACSASASSAAASAAAASPVAAVASSSSLASASAIQGIKKVKNNNNAGRQMFVDSLDHLPITSLAMVGSDGLIYDATRAAARTPSNQTHPLQVLYACRDDDGSSTMYWRDHEDLRVDPITCNELVSACVGNDGFIYDAATFAFAKKEQYVLRGGVVMVSCVPCRSDLWTCTTCK